jgi:LmbE family N-acetylglucosaminyl deacetylase
MNKLIILIILIFISGCSQFNQYTIIEKELSPKNILVFAAHQDDETICAGGRMIQSKLNNKDVNVVILTDGSPKEFRENGIIASIRNNETINALNKINISQENIIFLNNDDLGFIFDSNDKELINKIKEIIEEKNPDEIYIPAYEGGHIDHDSTHILVLSALKKINKKFKIYECIEYNSYNWGSPIPDNEDIIDNEKNPVMELTMNENEINLKKEMLKSYISQKPNFNKNIIGYKSKITEFDYYIQDKKNKVIGNRIKNCEEDYLVCAYYWNDLLRELPSYDYNKRPHPPKLLYEKQCDYDKRFSCFNFNDFKDKINDI